MVLPPAALFPGEKEIPPQEPIVTAVLEESMVRSLIRLEEAINPKKPEKPRHVTVRLVSGVTDHFKTRVSEWFAAAVLVQFGWILYSPEQVFNHSPNFAVMSQWAHEETWGLFCLIIGAIHLLALSVNGTFRSFKYSPHIRAISSFIACYMWFQITLAIFLSGVGGTGFGTYRLVLLLELWNFIRACQDVGKTEARRALNGQ